ncbi:MAG: hypothetical protein NTY45_15940, partial [Elusimicrobia bacterium]|nr:hypothetical protein [Elusimicrobiota bacterium]
PVSTAQQTALNLKANLTGATFSGAIAATNLYGTNTGDQTTITGNAGTVTNGVYTTGDQTIGGTKTFSSTIVGGISGNAATVTTNANLTGVVTSVGNATSIADSAISNAMLANSAVANLSGTNSGDNAANTTYAGDYRAANFAAGTNYLAPNGNGSALTDLTAGQVGLGSVDNTSDLNKPISTTTLTALNLKANLAGATFTGAIAATNLSGTNSGDQTTITGNSGTATSIAGGTGGEIPYQSAADTTTLLPAGTTGKILQSNGADAPSWVTPVSGDVYLASSQTFTGQNTFISTITAKGYVNASQSVVLTSETSFAADGSGVVLLTFSGSATIGTITGCSSGVVGQGQAVTFVVAAWTVGGVSFTDTLTESAANDTMLLNTTAGIWTPNAGSGLALGSTITLMCTTINKATPAAPNFVKLWVEIGRSKTTDG